MQQLRTMNTAFNNYFEVLRKEDEYSYREIDMMLESDLFNQYYSVSNIILSAFSSRSPHCFCIVNSPQINGAARVFRNRIKGIY